MIRRSAPVVALALVLGACGVDSTSHAWEKDGEQVDLDKIAYNRGVEHCGWQDVTFLDMDWPPDDPAAPSRRQYLWDPKGILDDRTLTDSTDDAELPGDARFTGYSSDLGELWLAPSDQDTRAYLVSEDGDEVETWGRTDRTVGCD
ncbi:hypothetical protein [Nocardioides sp. T2.26MG-1]|uniref:hypothetical protein n=1 Tax=Nocardioides sp. T2.26MG-1 TaxID=3041166 RepID=UPI002477C491|nr:hypothetical protein [Nocardioides sp. T2.26MG-1]CAI9406294.1 hypothetical protein HIDPHFAB_04554 [Nocardioides sp. T2.26MG-1]